MKATKLILAAGILMLLLSEPLRAQVAPSSQARSPTNQGQSSPTPEFPSRISLQANRQRPRPTLPASITCQILCLGITRFPSQPKGSPPR